MLRLRRPRPAWSRMLVCALAVLVLAVVSPAALGRGKGSSWEKVENESVDELKRRIGARMVYCRQLDAVAVFGGYVKDKGERVFHDHVDILDTDDFEVLADVQTIRSSETPRARKGHFMHALDGLARADEEDACWFVMGGGNFGHTRQDSRRTLRTRSSDGDEDDDDFVATSQTGMAGDIWLARVTRPQARSANIEWIPVAANSESSSHIWYRVGTAAFVRSVDSTPFSSREVAINFGLEFASVKSAGAKDIRLALYGGAIYGDGDAVPEWTLGDVIDVKLEIVYTSLGGSDARYKVDARTATTIPIRHGPKPEGRFAMNTVSLWDNAGRLSGFAVAGGRSASRSQDEPGSYRIFDELWQFDFDMSTWTLLQRGVSNLRHAYSCTAQGQFSQSAISLGGLAEVAVGGDPEDVFRFERSGTLYIDLDQSPSSRCGGPDDRICVYERELFQPAPGLGFACASIDDNRILMLGGTKPDRFPQNAVWVLDVDPDRLNAEILADQFVMDLSEVSAAGPDQAAVGPGGAVGIAVALSACAAFLILFAERRRAAWGTNPAQNLETARPIPLHSAASSASTRPPTPPPATATSLSPLASAPPSSALAETAQVSLTSL